MPAIYVSDKSKLPKRVPNDFYPTPINICRLGMNCLPNDFTPMTVLDPGMGTGVWGEVVREKYPDVWLRGIDIRDIPENSNYDMSSVNRDYLDSKWVHLNYSLVIGNPPYYAAEKFVRKSIDSLDSDGYLLFLLRLDFLASKGRIKGIHKTNPPKEVHIIGRVSFTGDNKTDGNEYAFFIWQKDYIGETTLKWVRG